MLQRLLHLVAKNPTEKSYYQELIHIYQRQGDRANELKWLEAKLRQWPEANWEEWLDLVNLAHEEKKDILCWQALLSSYFYQPADKSWPEGQDLLFASHKKAFMQSLNEQHQRFYEFDLIAPAIHFHYVLGPWGMSISRNYLEEQLPRLIQTQPQGVIFEWSALKDVDTFLGGFLATALENFTRLQIPVYLVPPTSQTLHFLFQFLQLTHLLEKCLVVSEFTALSQLKKKFFSSERKPRE